MSARPYDDLVALAEVELELARSGDYAALGPVQRAWQTLTATLPGRAPLSAAPQLKRAAALNADAQRLLRERAELARDGLRRIDQGRRALEGYAEPVPPQTRVDFAG
jgi:hypothetical protein